MAGDLPPSSRFKRFSVPEAAAILRIGRTMAYAQARLWRATGGREGLPVLTLGHSEWALLPPDVHATLARIHRTFSPLAETLGRVPLMGVIPVGDKSRLEALTAEHDAEHLGQGGVVIDDQHATFHGPHRSTEAAPGAVTRLGGAAPRKCSTAARRT